MRGPGGAFLLVGLEMVAGTFVLMWVTMLGWRAVDRGHYRAAAWVLSPTTLALALLLPGRLRGPGLLAGLLMAAFLVAVYSQRPALESAAGGAASAACIWMLVQAGMASCDPGCTLGAAHALAGAFFLGAVTHGMTLGHWYLNQPRLPIEPLKGATWIMLAATGASAAAGVATRGPLLAGIVPGGILTVSSAGYWWSWLLLLAGTAGLGLMIRTTVWARSTQSATGLYYVAMIMALAAQFVLALLVAS